MNRKLLQQSLDALYLIFRSTPPYKENGECTLTDDASKLCCETIDALEAELAKPEPEQEYDHASDAMSILADINVDLIQDANPEQEPVCGKDPMGCWSVRCQLGKLCKNTLPQRKEWVGLTADEMQAAYLKIDSWSACVDFIEAKLKEKNHG